MTPSTPTATTEITIRYVPLDQVAGWPRNPKQHDFPTLIDSLKRFGFTQPLVPDAKTGRLVAGHGRLEALIRMKAMGAPPPKRIGVAEDGAWTVPVLQGIEFANEQEAEAFLLADNQISALGGWDEAGLDAMLRDLDDLCGVGFDFPDMPAADLHALETLASTPSEATPILHEPRLVPALAGATRVGFTLGNVIAPPAPPAAPVPVYRDPVFGALSAPSARSASLFGGQAQPQATPGTVPWKAVLQPNAPAYELPNPDDLDDSDEDTSDLSPVVGQYGSQHSTGLPHVRFHKHKIPVTPLENDALEARLAAYIEVNGSMHGFFSELFDAADALAAITQENS